MTDADSEQPGTLTPLTAPALRPGRGFDDFDGGSYGGGKHDQTFEGGLLETLTI